MRYIFLFLFGLTLSAISAQGVGIKFSSNDWEDVIEEARKENKLIFIDGHTSWCAPCKVMDEYVFTHELGGALYNKNFINVKMDMEEGIGPLFASRYGVTTYPTFLFLTWDGTLVYRSIGYQNIEKLVSEGETALQPYRRERAMQDRFSGGDRIPDFLHSLTDFKMERNDETYKELIPLYLEAQPNWSSPHAVEFIFQHVDDFDSNMFKYMAEHKMVFSEVVGYEEFNEKYKGFIDGALKNNGQPISLERREEIYKIAYPTIADRMITEYKMGHYEDLGDDEAYAETAFYYYMKYEPTDDEGIRKSIPLFEKHLDSAEAKSFVKSWYITDARTTKTPMSLIRLATYSLDDGDFDKAKSLAKEAKKLSKSLGQDQQPAKDFMKQIKIAKKAAKK